MSYSLHTALQRIIDGSVHVSERMDTINEWQRINEPNEFPLFEENDQFFRSIRTTNQQQKLGELILPAHSFMEMLIGAFQHGLTLHTNKRSFLEYPTPKQNIPPARIFFQPPAVNLVSAKYIDIETYLNNIWHRYFSKW
jgi:hypothetical protein